jgi:hypothetical protein
MQRTLALALTLCLSASAHAAVTCFGLGNITGTGVYQVNFTTPSVTLAFPTPSVGSWFGAANGDSPTSFFGAGRNFVYRIDVVAQTVTPLTTDSSLEIRELAYRAGTHTLFGTDYSNLYTIDTTTGAATLIGPMGPGFVVGVMEYDPSNDRLLVINHSDESLYAVDPSTAIPSFIGSTGNANLTDLWIDQSTDQFYTSANIPIRLGTLDPSTGVATDLATVNYDSRPTLNGLAAPLPDPAISSLIFLAPFAICRRRSSQNLVATRRARHAH